MVVGRGKSVSPRHVIMFRICSRNIVGRGHAGHEFEWDDEKAARSFRKHGVTFEKARDAFNDPDSMDEDDPDPHEERFSRLCKLGQEVFMVVYTERGARIRIVSARLATEHEQRIYFQQ